MSHLLKEENWPSPKPRSLAYHCGPAPDADPIPPFSDHGFPARESKRVKKMAVEWLEKNAAWLWPQAADPANPTGLDWSKLADPKNRTGKNRMNAQYWRINIDPTERYTLSVKGSSGYRLRADQSGFDNLFLAGDWTYTAINAGCVEAAVMSGLRAARGLSGFPKRIIGEDSWW